MKMNGNNPDSSGITIPGKIISGLIRHWNITPNGLGALVLPTDIHIDGEAENIRGWLDSHDAEEIDWIQRIITWVTSPVEIANVTFFSHDLFVDRVHVHFTRPGSDAPAVLQRDDAENIHFWWQPEKDTIIEMIYQHLASPGLIRQESVSFGFSRSEAEIFFTCCDLVKRSRMNAMLRHVDPPASLYLQEIRDLLHEVKNEPDLRWLHPFFSAYFGDGKSGEIKKIESVLSGLEKQGIVESVGDGVIHLSESGKILSYALNYAPSRVGISTAIVFDSRPAVSTRMVLIRTAGQIWFITENPREPDSIIMTTIPPETMKEMLTEAFMLPSQTSHPSFDQSKNQPDSGLITCPHCNTSLPSSAKFCRKCGKPVNREAT